MLTALCRCGQHFFFFNDTATTEIYPLSLHDALPILDTSATDVDAADFDGLVIPGGFAPDQLRRHGAVLRITREIFQDRKSTRLNSSHSQISYAVFCLKKNNCCWRPNVPPGRDLLRFS